jgi:hypothetical protein
MQWFFFILLNAAFFIRPADLVQSADIPLYNLFTIACLIVAGARVPTVVTTAGRSPVTVCVLGIVAAIVLSHLSHANLGRAADEGLYIVKIVIHYLLLVALVDTPARLQSFLRWLVLFTLILTVLALAHFYGVVRIDSLEACMQQDIDPETGEQYTVPRLRSTGVFSDPNDLSMILVFSIIICLSSVDRDGGGVGRYCWLLPIGVFVPALGLTASRGGLLNLGISLIILSWVKLGSKKTLIMGLIVGPAILALFGGRMTRIDVTDSHDTSQERIQLWSAGLDFFREAPLFGIGMNEFADRAGLVAHNSFVHTYAELGFFGGTCFAGAFYAAIAGVTRLGRAQVEFSDQVVLQLRPYVLAMICSFCVGLFSLSRPYTITTYVAFGVAASYLRVAEQRTSIAGIQFDSHFVKRLLFVGIGCVVFLYLFVRAFVRFH